MWTDRKECWPQLPGETYWVGCELRDSSGPKSGHMLNVSLNVNWAIYLKQPAWTSVFNTKMVGEMRYRQNCTHFLSYCLTGWNNWLRVIYFLKKVWQYPCSPSPPSQCASVLADPCATKPGWCFCLSLLWLSGYLKTQGKWYSPRLRDAFGV